MSHNYFQNAPFSFRFGTLFDLRFSVPGEVLDRGRPLTDRGLAGLPRQPPYARGPHKESFTQVIENN